MAHKTLTTVNHISWPLCTVCRSTGEDTHKRGPCGVCDGKGRVRPDGWEDPIIDDVTGKLLDPGTHPDWIEQYKDNKKAAKTPA